MSNTLVLEEQVLGYMLPFRKARDYYTAELSHPYTNRVTVRQ